MREREIQEGDTGGRLERERSERGERVGRGRGEPGLERGKLGKGGDWREKGRKEGRWEEEGEGVLQTCNDSYSTTTEQSVGAS